VFQDLAKEALSGSLVSVACDQNIEDLAILVYRSPKIMALAADRDEQLVHLPDVTETALSPPQGAGIPGSKLATPGSNRFVGHRDATLSEKVLDIAKAESEPMVQPNGMADDLDGKRCRRYSDPIGRFSPTAVYLTMPPDTENRMSGGVGGWRGLNPRHPTRSREVSTQGGQWMKWLCWRKGRRRARSASPYNALEVSLLAGAKKRRLYRFGRGYSLVTERLWVCGGAANVPWQGASAYNRGLGLRCLPAASVCGGAAETHRADLS